MINDHDKFFLYWPDFKNFLEKNLKKNNNKIMASNKIINSSNKKMGNCWLEQMNKRNFFKKIIMRNYKVIKKL